MVDAVTNIVARPQQEMIVKSGSTRPDDEDKRVIMPEIKVVVRKEDPKVLSEAIKNNPSVHQIKTKDSKEFKDAVARNDRVNGLPKDKIELSKDNELGGFDNINQTIAVLYGTQSRFNPYVYANYNMRNPNLARENNEVISSKEVPSAVNSNNPYFVPNVFVSRMALPVYEQAQQARKASPEQQSRLNVVR